MRSAALAMHASSFCHKRNTHVLHAYHWHIYLQNAFVCSCEAINSTFESPVKGRKACCTAVTIAEVGALCGTSVSDSNTTVDFPAKENLVVKLTCVGFLAGTMRFET